VPPTKSRRYLQDLGEPPRAGHRPVGLGVAAPAATICAALWYLGAADLGQGLSGSPASKPAAGRAHRPRIDVTLRISGLFRDIFERQIALFDMAVRRSPSSTRRRRQPLGRAATAPMARVFGGAPAATAQAADTALDGDWRTRDERARSISPPSPAPMAPSQCAARASATRFRGRRANHPEDDRERPDGDGVAGCSGLRRGHAVGNDPELYHLDTSQTEAPKRWLAENRHIVRVARNRVGSPACWRTAIAASPDRPGRRCALRLRCDGPWRIICSMQRRRLTPTRGADSDDGNRRGRGVAARLRDALARGLWTSGATRSITSSSA
jgi:cobaltochelatase CobN